MSSWHGASAPHTGQSPHVNAGASLTRPTLMRQPLSHAQTHTHTHTHTHTTRIEHSRVDEQNNSTQTRETLSHTHSHRHTDTHTRAHTNTPHNTRIEHSRIEEHNSLAQTRKRASEFVLQCVLQCVLQWVLQWMTHVTEYLHIAVCCSVLHTGASIWICSAWQ